MSVLIVFDTPACFPATAKGPITIRVQPQADEQILHFPLDLRLKPESGVSMIVASEAMIVDNNSFGSLLHRINYHFYHGLHRYAHGGNPEIGFRIDAKNEASLDWLDSLIEIQPVDGAEVGGEIKSVVVDEVDMKIVALAKALQGKFVKAGFADVDNSKKDGSGTTKAAVEVYSSGPLLGKSRKYEINFGYSIIDGYDGILSYNLEESRTSVTRLE